MRVQVSDLSCVAFVCCVRQNDLDEIHGLCRAYEPILRANPLGLLSIIYDQRTRCSERLVTRLWLDVDQIEGLTRSRPEQWTKDPIYHRICLDGVKLSMVDMTELSNEPVTVSDLGHRPKNLSDTDTLYPRLYGTDTEISHGQNVMSFAVRYGDWCLEAVSALDASRKSFGGLLPGARAMVEDRIRFTHSRCQALQDRFTELKARHRSQIDAVSSR
jgi:hypothetical protein